MGAWSYAEPRIRDLLLAKDRPLPVSYVGRPERASPAEGYHDRHVAEQARIDQTALTESPVLVGANGRGRGRTASANGADNGANQKTAKAGVSAKSGRRTAES
jgi:hypothetical protein